MRSTLESIGTIREYLFGTESLRYCKEKETLYPSRSSELRGIRADIIATKIITDIFSLTGLLTPFAPYFIDASNPKPCKGAAILIGLATITYSEFIRNYFSRQLKKARRAYKEASSPLESEVAAVR